MSKETVVLNAGFEPLSVISWKKAIQLVFLGRAEIIETYQKVILTINNSFPRPKVIRLFKYIHLFFKPKILAFSRKNIILRDEFCQYCGSTDNLTIDHVIPKSRGGTNTWENVVAACFKCNNKKGSKTPEEAGLSLKRKPFRPKNDILLKKSFNLKL